MKTCIKKIVSWLLTLAVITGMFTVAIPGIISQAAEAQLPDVVTAAIVGDLQTQLGASDNWDPASHVTEMNFYDNGLFEFICQLPAGDFEYKVALNDSWSASYPNDNINLSVLEDGSKVVFRYNSFTNEVFDSINNPDQFVTAAVVGTVEITSGDAIGWTPETEVSEMEYMGGGVYKLETPVVAGEYEYKVALNDSWDESYPNPDNKALNIIEDGNIVFYYNHNTHSVKDTVNDSIITAALAGDFQKVLGASGDWDPASPVTEMSDVDEDGVYMFQAYLPKGSYEYKVTLNDDWNGACPGSNVSLTIPSDGSTVLFLFDNNNKIVKDSINDASTAVQRYIEFKYFREDGDYSDWNLWVWGTGKKDDQINFTEFKDGFAIAKILLGSTNNNVGFIIRKGEWVEKDYEGDRSIDTTGQVVTKVTVYSGKEEVHTVPRVTAPVNNNGAISFYYRDEQLYQKNLLHTLAENGNGVKLKFNGIEYQMQYHSEDEFFIFTIEDVEFGTYEYSYIITKDESTLEIPDPMNMVDGISKIVYIRPTATITASIAPKSISYNENAVLSVDVELSEGNVSALYADLSALGGKPQTAIDPEINSLNIVVRDNVTAGVKQIPITVIDEFGNDHISMATVEVIPRESAGDQDFDWDEARIYFLLTDRFNDGDPTNNDPNGENYSSTDPGTYFGGDFRGIIDKLDYLSSLGINTIWISPIVDNINYNVRTGEDISYYAYHGYWAKDFTKIEEHFGDLEVFKELIDRAHDKGIKIMVDVVLNHTGYGLKASDADKGAGISNYPTNEDRARFEGMLRAELEGGDIKNELAGLPDFVTEDPLVRAQIINWQIDWLNKARTDRGDTIDYFRVDTVKHVEDTTWKAFKNALTDIKPEFKMIGEWYGAGVSNTAGQLQSGQMDSLLDFEFNDIAAKFVNGKINEADSYLQTRSSKINNAATLGQFLSSHDEDGFLNVILSDDKGKMKVAAALQITEKGQPVIYYGEEIGLSGLNNYPQYDNRPQMPWGEIEANNAEMMDFFNHYQKLLAIRGEYSKLFSKGTRTTVGGGDSEGYIVVKRSYEGNNAYVALNTSAEAARVSIDVSYPDGSVFLDEYSGTEYSVTEGKLVFTIPGKNSGGTAILTTNVKSEEKYIRIHYNRTKGDYEGFGLWLWNDVATPSDNWPTGATQFISEQSDGYGAYLDIPLKEGAKKIGFLVVDTNGNKDGGDKSFTIALPEMDEIWIKQGSDTVFNYEPVNLPNNTIRVHYIRDDQNYGDYGLWVWDDVASPSEGWPTGASPFTSMDRYGAYVDVSLIEAAKNIGFLVVNRNSGDKDGENKGFNLLNKYNHVWIKEGDDTVYISPYWEIATGLLSAEVVSESKILLGFTMTDGLVADGLKNDIQIIDKNDNPIIINSASITGDTTVELIADINLNNLPLKVTFAGRTVSAATGWRMMDEMYYYDGNDLGATYNNGNVTLKLWAPKATKVVAKFYDKADATKLIGSLELTKGDKGIWTLSAKPDDFEGVKDLLGYFYQYEVTNDGVTKKVLDPYAKSLAIFRVDSEGNVGPDGDDVGKAAIIDLSKTNPDNFSSANIKGYQKREDAIIWEVHVRDFTSDTTIEGDLNSRWGSYSAFIDKLDYIKSLGVTHIQILPVMAWYYGDEAAMGERENEYSTKNNNYNWGYDPQSYFAPDGAYSLDPTDPELRVKELKELIDAIHKSGMGVILDVVYTHMAKADFLNDIVPNYYAFQDANGNFLGGFGNNLATNRKMAEKLMVDSVKYWFEEYKIDGMRFDMMGDATYDAIQNAYNAAAGINPKALFIGEGWRTFAGDISDPTLAGKGADQDWMDKTDDVAVFSDEIRNELKSGFGCEGDPRFVTGGARDISLIFKNIKGQPENVAEDDPGDIVQYIAAHDNLTLHDVIAQSIKKDPSIPQNELEIHKRIRLGNSIILTSQGVAFLHAGQEYGRTKQWLGEGLPEHKYHTLEDESGNVFGYFVHDSYDSSDAVNQFDWAKATDTEQYPINTLTQKYTQGLIALRKSTNAFRLGSQSLVNSNVTLINAPEIKANDLVIGYKNVSTDGTGKYYVFINADNTTRTLSLNENLTTGKVLVDNDEAGTTEVLNKSGFDLTADSIVIEPLTVVVIKKMPAKSSSDTGSRSEETKTNVKDTSVTVTKTISASVDSSGKATTSVTNSQIGDAIGKANQAAQEAEKQGQQTNAIVEIKIDAEGAKTVEMSLPKTAMDSLLAGSIDKLKIATSVATINFSSEALATIAGNTETDINFTVSMLESSTLSEELQKTVGDRPVYDFSVTSQNKTISQFNGNVEVSVPYTPKEDEDLNAIIIYFINDEGKPEIVRNCYYDALTGMVKFNTSHFSKYAVGYNNVTFKDVPEIAWYCNAVKFIAARGITSGTGNNNFSPYDKLTRAQFLVMAMKAYDIDPDKNPQDNFSDAGNTYYTGYLATAKRLGVAAGTGNNVFMPNRDITRQEMFTLLYNILDYVGKLPKGTSDNSLSAFEDASQISDWARNAMETLVKADIIIGNDNRLFPDETASRAQMAQLMYGLLTK